jgi:hypothetical protein
LNFKLHSDAFVLFIVLVPRTWEKKGKGQMKSVQDRQPKERPVDFPVGCVQGVVTELWLASIAD